MERTLDFTAQARYSMSGEITEKTTQVWYVLHGYGQLARFFINKFKVLEENNICVIAPEGLSRFYLEDLETRARTGNQRVGATWMTRENREMDILNYVAMLDAIHRRETAHVLLPITLLGFSQGSATVTRWALQGNVPFRRLILWAGVFPPDMNFENGHEILKTKEVVAVFGDQDPFVTPERIAEMESLSARLQITPRVIRFSGIHDLDEETLKGLGKKPGL